MQQEQWTIYYNPKCGTCQKVLKMITDQGITPTIVEYLKNPPSLKQLDSILRKLRVTPLEMIRSKEPIFEKLKLGEGEKSRKDLLRAVSENPVLLQRPIVIRGYTAAIIARPPERVTELF